jgi:hypothetical protein
MPFRIRFGRGEPHEISWTMFFVGIGFLVATWLLIRSLLGGN